MPRQRLLAVLACTALAACGARHAASPQATPAARARAAAAPRAESAAPAPVAALPKAEAVADGESVGDATFTVSPIARAIAGTAPQPVPAIPARWVAGKHYRVLVPTQPTSSSPDKVEVVEVFWYGCPHCFRLEPGLENWDAKARRPYVQLRRVPIIWEPDPVKRAHARLYYTLEALGKADALAMDVFREIHVSLNPLVDPTSPANTEQLQKAFLVAHGVSAADFDRTYRSPGVEANLQRAEQLAQRYQITGVPTLVVAGKYTADVSSAGSESDLFTLAGDLAASEHHR